MNFLIAVDKDHLIESILEAAEWDQVMDIILKLDLRIAEVDFTQVLIQKLVESLKTDLTKEGLTERFFSEIMPIIEG